MKKDPCPICEACVECVKNGGGEKCKELCKGCETCMLNGEKIFKEETKKCNKGCALATARAIAHAEHEQKMADIALVAA